jgi:hypothetical protein
MQYYFDFGELKFGTKTPFFDTKLSVLRLSQDSGEVISANSTQKLMKFRQLTYFIHTYIFPINIWYLDHYYENFSHVQISLTGLLADIFRHVKYYSNLNCAE